MMFQRTIAILREYQEIWPFASRWVEALDRFIEDQGSTIFSTEGGITGGRDPLFQAGIAPSTASGSSTSPSPSLYKVSSHLTQASSSLQSPTQSITLPFAPANTHMLHAQFHHHVDMQPPGHGDPQYFVPPTQQLNPHLYMTSNDSVDVAQQSTNSLGIPLGVFQPPEQQNHAAVAASVHSYAASSSRTAAANAFYPQPELPTDGFDSELQYYIDGPREYLQTSGAFDRDYN